MKILKVPVHLLESRRIHLPASPAQAFPITRSSYNTNRRCNTKRVAVVVRNPKPSYRLAKRTHQRPWDQARMLKSLMSLQPSQPYRTDLVGTE